MSTDPWRTVTNVPMEKLLRAIELFRRHDPELPSQVISVFLYIASHDDCTKVQLGDDDVGLGMSSASCSRNADWLSGRHRLNKEGLGWVEKYRDPTDQRKILYRLNTQGKSIVRDLRHILYEN